MKVWFFDFVLFSSAWALGKYDDSLPWYSAACLCGVWALANIARDKAKVSAT